MRKYLFWSVFGVVLLLAAIADSKIAVPGGVKISSGSGVTSLTRSWPSGQGPQNISVYAASADAFMLLAKPSAALNDTITVQSGSSVTLTDLRPLTYFELYMPVATDANVVWW